MLLFAFAFILLFLIFLCWLWFWLLIPCIRWIRPSSPFSKLLLSRRRWTFLFMNFNSLSPYSQSSLPLSPSDRDGLYYFIGYPAAVSCLLIGLCSLPNASCSRLNDFYFFFRLTGPAIDLEWNLRCLRAARRWRMVVVTAGVRAVLYLFKWRHGCSWSKVK